MQRWFTDPAADGPAEVQATLTDVETATLFAILEFAKAEGNELRELMHCVDAEGLGVIDTSTGYRQAPHTDAMRAAMTAKGGVRLWHNHPSRESISNTDWKCAGIDGSIEVLALNDLGSMFVGRIAKWDERLDKLLDWLPRLAGDLEFHIQRVATTAGADPTQLVALGRMTGHVLNRALATRMPVRYAYRFIGPEDAMVASLDELGVLADGEEYAAAAIDDFLSNAESEA